MAARGGLEGGERAQGAVVGIQERGAQRGRGRAWARESSGGWAAE